MADAGKAKIADEGSQIINFTKFPPEALDRYVAYHNLARDYPPEPPREEVGEDEEEEEEGGGEGEGDEEYQMAGERRVQQSNETGNRTASRLRPRSPLPSSSARGASHQQNDRATRRQGGQSRSEALYGGGTRVVNPKRETSLSWLYSPAHYPEEHPPFSDTPCPPHFYDAEDAYSHLGNHASRHFRSQTPPKEGEVVVQFLYRCRAGGELVEETNRRKMTKSR